MKEFATKKKSDTDIEFKNSSTLGNASMIILLKCLIHIHYIIYFCDIFQGNDIQICFVRHVSVDHVVSKTKIMFIWPRYYI